MASLTQIWGQIFPELGPALGELSRLQAHYSFRDLEQGLSYLNQSHQKQIRHRLGTHFSQWNRLSRNTSPEVFAQSLGKLARGLEGEDLLAAQGIYQWAQTNLPKTVSQPMVHRLAVTEGRRGILPRVPVMLNQFSRQALDPVMIGSFMVAGAVNGVVRQGVSQFLTHRGATHWMRAGMGRQVLSGTAGFVAEVPAFVGAGRGLDYVFSGFQPNGTHHSLSDEMAGAALFLGAMKLSGFFTGQILRNTSPKSLRFRSGQFAGTLAGIYAGQRLERKYHGIPHGDEAMAWVEAFNTYLQLHVGGRLAHTLTRIGPVRAEPDVIRVRRESRGEFSWQRDNGLAFALAGRTASKGPRASLVNEIPIYFSTRDNGNGDGGSEGRRPRRDTLKRIQGKTVLQHLEKQRKKPTNSSVPPARRRRRVSQRITGNFLVGEGKEANQALVRNVDETRFPVESKRMRSQYYKFIEAVLSPRLDLSPAQNKRYLVHLGQAAMYYRVVLALDPFRRDTDRGFGDYVLQVAFERVLLEKDVEGFRALNEIACKDFTIRELEDFVSKQGWRESYRAQVGLLSNDPRAARFLDQLDQYPTEILDKVTKIHLAAYLATLGYGKEARSFSDPEYNFFRISDAGLDLDMEMSAEYALAVLKKNIDKNLQNREWLEKLRRVRERAENSPMGLLYYDRLIKSFEFEQGTGPMEELGRP